MKYAWWVLCFITQQLAAQTNDRPATYQGNYDRVSGNPYLLKDWNDGVVRFSSGRVVKQFKLKFDCVKNQLLLQFNGTAFGAESNVKEFVIYPKNKVADSMVFRKGYPAADNTTEETFYQVLVEGRLGLLRWFSKTVLEEKQLVGGQGIRRLEDEQKLFWLKEGKLLPVTMGQERFAAQLPDKAAALQTFITEERLKMRTVEDVIRVTCKYNELL